MKYIFFSLTVGLVFIISCSKPSEQSRTSETEKGNLEKKEPVSPQNGCTKIKIRPNCGNARLFPAHLHEDAFVAGEIRAYELEIELMENYLKGTFHKALSNTAQRLAGRPVACLEDFRELDALFPPVESVIEREIRNTTYAVALAFQYAKQSGNPDVTQEKMKNFRKLFTH